MDLIHIKYALEVEKARSITKAAENLFMSQPNLSRAIRELEASLNIKIFKRTSNGVIPTEQGEEFLDYGREILSQVEKIESIYDRSQRNKLSFSISAPEAVYITNAFASMVSSLPSSRNISFNYMTTDNLQIIDSVAQNSCSIGIIRHNAIQEKYYFKLLKEKGLIAEPILEFQYTVLMSKSHPLSGRKEIIYKDLSDYIEISGRDPNMSSAPLPEARNEMPLQEDKRLLTSGASNQLYLLSTIPMSYMWAPPLPLSVLEHYPLVQRKCADFIIKYTDSIIYRSNHNINDLDSRFISELHKTARQVLKNS